MPESNKQRQALYEASIYECASFSLRRAGRLVGQLFDDALQPTGLKSTQFSLLLIIETNQGKALQDIARIAGLSPSTLSRNLQPLLNKHLIDVSGSNRSGKRVTVTKEGHRHLERALPLWQAVQTEFVEAIGGEATWQRLRNGIRRATERIQDDE